jgi:hypothetical protein
MPGMTKQRILFKLSESIETPAAFSAALSPPLRLDHVADFRGVAIRTPPAPETSGVLTNFRLGAASAPMNLFGLAGRLERWFDCYLDGRSQ